MEVIDTFRLKEYEKELENEIKNFKLNTYKVFKNSYIIKSDNEVIKQISLKLDKIYKDIEHSYDNINNFFKDYLNDAIELELCLSKKGKVGLIKESELRNYLDSKIYK